MHFRSLLVAFVVAVVFSLSARAQHSRQVFVSLEALLAATTVVITPVVYEKEKMEIVAGKEAANFICKMLLSDERTKAFSFATKSVPMQWNYDLSPARPIQSQMETLYLVLEDGILVKRPFSSVTPEYGRRDMPPLEVFKSIRCTKSH